MKIKFYQKNQSNIWMFFNNWRFFPYRSYVES